MTHSLMLGEVGPAMLAALFLEINAGVIALIHRLISGTRAYRHRGSVLYSTAASNSREQVTHSFLEMVIFTNWNQFLALIGSGSERARFDIRLKRPPLRRNHALAILGAVGLFGAVPHADELRRCWQAERRALTGADTPECLRELFAS